MENNIINAQTNEEKKSNYEGGMAIIREMLDKELQEKLGLSDSSFYIFKKMFGEQL